MRFSINKTDRLKMEGGTWKRRDGEAGSIADIEGPPFDGAQGDFRMSWRKYSRSWGNRGITAFDALAAFDGFDALARLAAFDALVALGVNRTYRKLGFSGERMGGLTGRTTPHSTR